MTNLNQIDHLKVVIVNQVRIIQNERAMVCTTKIMSVAVSDAVIKFKSTRSWYLPDIVYVVASVNEILTSITPQTKRTIAFSTTFSCFAFISFGFGYGIIDNKKTCNKNYRQ